MSRRSSQVGHDTSSHQHPSSCLASRHNPGEGVSSRSELRLADEPYGLARPIRSDTDLGFAGSSLMSPRIPAAPNPLSVSTLDFARAG